MPLRNPPLPTGCPAEFFAARWRALHQEKSPCGRSRSRRKPCICARFASGVLREGRKEKVDKIGVDLGLSERLSCKGRWSTWWSCIHQLVSATPRC